MSFFEELKRRNIIKVTIAYVVVGWLMSQVAEFATENFGAPEWVLKTFVVFLLLGLPLVLIFTWAFEMTPEGLKREKDVDRSLSITHKTGRKLDFTIIGVLLLVAAYFIYESRFASQKGPGSISGDTAQSAVRDGSGNLNLTPTVNPALLKDNSIAVLPFANRSRLEDDEFFTDGIHDDLLTQLAKIRDLKVISRTSMMKYKDTQLSIPEIGKELGVSTILEGGVQRAGKRIRINAQLIDVATDQHLWAETFDREMTMENIFDIQSEITRQIVSAVRGELTEAESLAINELPTANLKAYEAFLKARLSVNNPNYAMENFINAQPWAEIAVQLDPQFAEAWSLLARIHGMAIWIGYDNTDERHQLAKKAVDMTTLLAPESPSSWLAQAAYFYRVEEDFSSSLQALQKAHDALPGNVEILGLMALAQRRLGLWEDSVNNFLKELELDPENSASATRAIGTLTMMHDWERVLSLGAQWSNKFSNTDLKVHMVAALIGQSGDLASARKAFNEITPVAGSTYVDMAVFLPTWERDYQAIIDIWNRPEVAAMAGLNGYTAWQESSRGFAYLQLGEAEKAKEQLDRAVEILTNLKPDSNSRYAYDLGNLAWVYALQGDHKQALEISEKAMAISRAGSDQIDGAYIAGFHAQILGMTGHRDEALAEIERLLETPAGLVRWNMYLDPAWDFFRDDERFNELIKPLNLEDENR